MGALLKTIRRNLEQFNADLQKTPTPTLKEARRWADALRRGRIFFYGDREVEIGLQDIDWSGKHIDHQEWPAQLNRFFVLSHLVELYQETQEDDLPTLARQLIEDWIRQHDYSADQPPAAGDNTLNISIRIGQSPGRGWWSNVPAWADTEVFDDDFVERMIESSRGQLDCLRAYIAGQSNWRISHLDCMLFCALVVPGLDKYKAFAVRNLNEAFHRQIHADGSHEEHNPSYHGWMCRVFTDYWRLSRARPDLGLRLDAARVARMWDYAICSTAPDGGSFGLHDGGAWKPGSGKINGFEQRAAVISEAGLSGSEWDLEASPSQYFANAGQIFVRDSWQPDAAMLAFDATRWGGGHCHLSRNSVNLYAGSRMLLCDPGVFSYEMTDPFAPHGKSTPAHNTINFAGMNQSDADPHTGHVRLFEDAAVMASSYQSGYFPGLYTWGWLEGKRPGVFGIHNRAVLWLGGRGAVVWDDLVVDRPGQQYAAHWQFPAGPATLDRERRQAWTGGSEDNILVRLLAAHDEVGLSLREGQRTPERGWLPHSGPGDYAPAPQLAMEANAGDRCRSLTTLLLPFKGDAPPDVEATPFTCGTGRAQGFEFRWANGDQDIVAATPGLHYQVGEAGRIATDACLAAVSLRNGEPWRAIIVGGMFLEFDGATLIDRPNSGAYREVL